MTDVAMKEGKPVNEEKKTPDHPRGPRWWGIVLSVVLSGCFSEPPTHYGSDESGTTTSDGGTSNASMDASSAVTTVSPSSSSSSDSDSTFGEEESSSSSDGSSGESGDESSSGTGETIELVDMVDFDGGDFVIGCDHPTETQAGMCQANEDPNEYSVGPFALDAFEVTVERYQECVDDGDCSPRGDHGQDLRCTLSDEEGKPANCVTWTQARDFCAWEGKRLPTEGEWEYAATGGDENRLWPWGPQPTASCPQSSVSNSVGQSNCGAQSVPDSGAYAGDTSNEGVHDLAGSMSEWVWDWYDIDAYEMGAPPANGTTKVTRGASFVSPESNGGQFLRIRLRSAQSPDAQGAHIGFRCAVSL